MSRGPTPRGVAERVEIALSVHAQGDLTIAQAAERAGVGKTTLAKALSAQRDREASLRRQYVAESVVRHAALKGVR